MTPARSEIDPVPAQALSALSALTQPERPSSALWTNELVATLRARCRPVALSDDVILFPARRAGTDWHIDQLDRMLRDGGGDETPANAARRRYHARMLGFALAPERAEFRPLVTILLPVFDRAAPLIDAVQSCIDQTWRPIEILVVDDGSTDHPEAGLARFGDQVRLVRKPNGGVASARNLGLSLAEGDFIQLLDSDDLLCPRAIESKIEAFVAVPDADLCYGQTHWLDMRSNPPEHRPIRHRELADPRRSMIVQFAFLVPTVMIPRWRMLAAPPFEEDLKRSSDYRYWQEFGFAGIKVIGLHSEVAILRRFTHSLQVTPHPEDDSHALCLLRGFTGLARCPETWSYGYEYITLLALDRSKHWFTGDQSPRVRPVMAELIATLREGGMPRDGGRLSLLPLLASLRAQIEKLRREGKWSERNPDCVYSILASTISEEIEAADPLTERDVAFWARRLEESPRRTRLQRFFTTVANRATPHRAAEFADLLLRNATAIPGRHRAKWSVRLLAYTGAHPVGIAMARWVMSSGR